MKLLLLTTFFFSFMFVQATEYKGIIIDSETKAPIGFGSLIIAATSNGTITNEDGEFVIKSPNDQIEVVCSSLGFETDTFKLRASTNYNSLQLKPVIVDLNAVAVTPETYPKYVLLRAINKIKSCDSATIFSHAFYRQITKLDTIPTEFQEVAYNTKSFQSALVYGTAIEKGRYAVKEKDNIQFNNMFGYANRDIWGSVVFDYKNIFSNEANFKFELLKIINSETQKIAVIKASPRVSRSKKHNDSITYYIDTENFNILECKNTYYPDHFITSSNPIAKVKNEIVSYDIKYKNLTDSIMVADFIIVTFKFDLQYGLVYSKSNEITSKILFADHSLTKPSCEFSGVKRDANDRKMIDALPYDSAYWENNSAFKTTSEEAELIKSFNKSNSFDSQTKKK